MRKIIRARYGQEFTGAVVVGKDYAAIAGDPYNHVTASPGGVNISTGVGNGIGLQTMSPEGPFHRQMLFPLTLLAGPISPPKELPWPPYIKMLPKLPTMAAGLAAISSLAAGASQAI
jgi:hypothetical protein